MNGIEYIKDYRYKPMPTAPNEVVMYAKKKMTERGFEMKEGYWRKRVFLDWFDQLDKWRAHCAGNYHFLTLLLETCADDAKSAIQEELQKFEGKEWALMGYQFLREMASYGVTPPNYQDTN